MKQQCKINFLIIGHSEWFDSIRGILSDIEIPHTVQFISDLEAAKARLWHNSYDILIMEQKFSKEYTIKLSQMAYAMFRPSIIVCENKWSTLLYKIKHFFLLLQHPYHTFTKINKFTTLDAKSINQLVEYFHFNKLDKHQIIYQISGKYQSIN